MRGPASYTGEDVVELSLHGSPIVLGLVERLLISLGARAAGRGEFTRRAFLAGRLDLLQAEAVIDLIEAAGPVAAEEARGRLDRSLSSEICRISCELKDVLSVVEAHIDFDEDDLDPLPNPWPPLTAIVESMNALIRQSEHGRLRREGLRTVIVGKPNVGKSTLFNALLKSDRAIVTPHPGTTRDSLDERLLIGGEVFVLCDTAGVRKNPDPVEAEGIRRTKDRMRRADIIVAVIDGSSNLDQEDVAVLTECGDTPGVVVLNKTDLGRVIDPASDELGPAQRPRVCMSAKAGTGRAELEQILSRVAQGLHENLERNIPSTLTPRGVILMESAKTPILSILEQFGRGYRIDPEIVSLELRRGLEPLEEITGERVDDGILDRIFERFCVGK
jgi:tRNA modification GTPase